MGLTQIVVACLVATVGAFTAPIAVARAPAINMQMTDFSWRRSYNGKVGGAAPSPPAAAAPSGGMSVAQACIFMADPSLESVSFADKKSFLLSKGVSSFVITESACTASDTTLVL